jgi:hypothetical protein
MSAMCSSTGAVGPHPGDDGSTPLWALLPGGILQGLKGLQMQLLYVQAWQLPPWATLGKEWLHCCC